MRITYLHQYFNTPDMSGGTRSYEMARRLVAKGHEVNMVTSWREDDGRKGWFDTEQAGIKVHWLPVPYSNKMGFNERIGAFVRFALGATGKAGSLPADVVFATSTPLTIAFPGYYAAKCRKVRMVFEVRDLWPEVPIAVGALRHPFLQTTARMLERFAYGRSERIIALSPGMRDGVVRTGIPAERVSVIPNSADLDFFDPKRADAKHFRREHPEIGDAPLVVYPGAMGKINGVDYMARIAAASRELGLKLQFVVVGKNGQEEQLVKNTAKNLKVLGDNFHIYPSVPKRMMPDVMAATDVALSLVIDLKELWANSANKFFDALASGTPVAINYGGWQAELLKKSGAGIVLPPDDSDLAAKLLGDFMADKKRCGEAGSAARKLAEERFSRDQLADQLEQVLLSAAGHA